MSGFSNVVLMGNLARDPELRYIPQGKAVCNITLAISKGRRDDQKTLFIDCTLWGKAAETVSEYFRKGKPIIIQGELEQNTWEDRGTGQKRSKIKVIGRSFSFVPRSESGVDENGAAEEIKPAPEKEQKPEVNNSGDLGIDDIPF